VQEHGSGERRHSLNCTFGHTVLMVCANTAEFQLLTFAVAVCLERLGGKNAVISVIGLDGDTTIEGKPFIFNHSNEGLARSGRDLVVNEHMAGCVIGKNRTVSQLVFLGFFSKGMGQSARDRRYILVEGDAVAWLEIFTNQRINLLGVWDRSISVRPFC
jgi:hypothetical protein